MGNIKNKWGNHRPWSYVKVQHAIIVTVRATKLVNAKVVNVANVKEVVTVCQQH
jgi:hypothetical protein